MPKTAAQILTPVGRLNARALWPELRTQQAREDRARTYLTRAAVQLSEDGVAPTHDSYTAMQDDAACAFAWTDKYNEVLDTPGSLTVAEEGSSTWTAEQLDRMKQRADDAWAAYLAALDVIVGQVPVEAVPPTLSLRTVVRLR